MPRPAASAPPQLASAKKCGHLGGKVLVPTSEFVQKLQAARLAADVADVPTVIVARTDALGAYLLTSDIDPRDKPFCTGACGRQPRPPAAADARLPPCCEACRTPFSWAAGAPPPSPPISRRALC